MREGRSKALTASLELASTRGDRTNLSADRAERVRLLVTVVGALQPASLRHARNVIGGYVGDELSRDVASKAFVNDKHFSAKAVNPRVLRDHQWIGGVQRDPSCVAE